MVFWGTFSFRSQFPTIGSPFNVRFGSNFRLPFLNPRNGNHEGGCGCADRKTTRSPTQASKNGRKRIDQRLPPSGKRGDQPRRKPKNPLPLRNQPMEQAFSTLRSKGCAPKGFSDSLHDLNTIGERKLGQFSHNKIRQPKFSPEATGKKEESDIKRSSFSLQNKGPHLRESL